jgi:transposase-like protein
MDKAQTLPKTLQEAIIHFADFENCKEFMMQLRWPDGKAICPNCGSDDVAYLPNARVFKCYQKHARQKFSLKVGTIFEESPIALEKWLPVMWMLVNSKNGISSWEIHRAMGVTQKTAWFMLQRGRLAMQDESYTKLSGTIEADETYIGGKAKNMHLDKLTRLKMQGHVRAGTDGKSIVAGLLERDGKAKVKVMPNTRAYHMRSNVIENVEKGSTVYTDALRSYRNLPVDGFIHDFVDHTER